MNFQRSGKQTAKDKALHREGWEPWFCKPDNPLTAREMVPTTGKALLAPTQSTAIERIGTRQLKKSNIYKTEAS